MTAKSLLDIEGREYDWLAVDSVGQVGFFSTAGGGYAPEACLQDTDAHDRAIRLVLGFPKTTDALLAPRVGKGCDNDWLKMAERGFFAFDSDHLGGSYTLVGIPSLAVSIDDLPESVVAIVRSVRLPELNFSQAKEISTDMLKEKNL
jgi:hypothetical protein